MKSKVSLWERIKAWWNGYELRVVPKVKPQAEPPQHEVRVDPHEWDNCRIQLLQDVWGEGHSSPGDEDDILEMIKPFGLDPSKSVLDIGSGLGGCGRVMSNAFGVWVTCLERDKAMAEAGMEISTMAGLAKKAPVMVFAPEEYEFKPKSFDCIFSKEMFYSITGRERIFKDVCKALKEEGQLLFTDFVRVEGGDQQAVDDWLEAEPTDTELWTVLDYEKGFTQGNVQSRIAEDVTERYLEIVTQGWSDYMEKLKRDKINKEAEEVLFQEMDLWAKRTKALEGGGLRIYRFFAIRKASKMLSDW